MFRLFRFDVQRFDDLLPVIRFLRDLFGERLAVEIRRLDHAGLENLDDLRILQQRLDLLAQPRDDVLWRFGRHEDADPGCHVEARHGLGDGRHIGERRKPLFAANREAGQLAGFDMR